MTELTISVSEMRKRFDEYMQCMKLGEVIVITKYGKPIAKFTPAQKLQKEQIHPHEKAKKTGAKVENL